MDWDLSLGFLLVCHPTFRFSPIVWYPLKLCWWSPKKYFFLLVLSPVREVLSVHLGPNYDFGKVSWGTAPWAIPLVPFVQSCLFSGALSVSHVHWSQRAPCISFHVDYLAAVITALRVMLLLLASHPLNCSLTELPWSYARLSSYPADKARRSGFYSKQEVRWSLPPLVLDSLL